MSQFSFKAFFSTFHKRKAFEELVEQCGITQTRWSGQVCPLYLVFPLFSRHAFAGLDGHTSLYPDLVNAEADSRPNRQHLLTVHQSSNPE